jgi:hypothetical protein
MRDAVMVTSPSPVSCDAAPTRRVSMTGGPTIGAGALMVVRLSAMAYRCSLGSTRQRTTS